MSFDHKPRILFLYGSLRERSYSRLLAEEAARIIEALGAEVRFFHPHDLPIHNSVPETHPKVQELRDFVAWSEGQVWSSPEMHGNVSGLMKHQIDLKRVAHTPSACCGVKRPAVRQNGNRLWAWS